MAEIDQSLSEGVCIDEEVFFGPITDKERKIREHFENTHKNENMITGELPKINENDISRNDSLYMSFSVEDSKYDSFDDSLNEDLDKKPQGAKHASLKKSLEKLKHKKHGFYDSLEDVCSLASNIEKCSISCEVENEKQLIVDDSLRNLPATTNKSCVNEQIHFDDDSLAVIEIENTFDDSLEEFNVLSSIEIEEINDTEIITTEHQNVSPKVEQTPLSTSRNLFEVQVIYESKKEADLEESSGDKNMLYDSLSNSDLKDILKDSLEESEKCVDNILRHVSDASIINTQNSEQFCILPSIKIDETKDVNPMDSELKISEDLNCTPGTHFDTSVQIICDERQETVPVDQEESSGDKNVLYDSLSNSDLKDIIDSLEESENCIVNLQVSSVPTAEAEKLEQISIKSDILDDSVQIVYDNLQNLHSEENISNGVIDSELNVLKDTFENLQNSRHLDDQRIPKTASESSSLFSCTDVTKKSVSNNHNTTCLDSNANQDYKVCVDRLQSVSSQPDFCTSAIENCNFNKDTFTVDSCHLKLLDDNINVDKNLKFELHIEVTVGDKKCKIAAEDIELLPVTNLNSKISESNPLTLPPVESESSATNEKTDIPDSCSSGATYKNNEFNTNRENILSSDSNENDLYQEESVNEANVTRRSKAVSQHINSSDLKFHFCEHVDNENLLQALDLHDISTSFLNESIIQSNDSVIPLNLCSREQDIKKIKKSLFRKESKENISEPLNYCQKKVIGSPSKKNQSKLNYRNTPKSAQKSPSSKETTKRTPGTKIPVRKVENFVIPTAASSKLSKQVSSSLSAEKIKKQPYSQTPHSAEKKTPISTPSKTHHFCKVRNTIFSKVPQIVPSKKYINIQSPVAQYIRNTPGSSKTPTLDPVLRDCMNHMHQQMESPYHLYQVPKSGSAKSAKRKV